MYCLEYESILILGDLKAKEQEALIDGVVRLWGVECVNDNGERLVVW